MRGGQYEGWLPNLFVGNLLQRKTVGIIGAGRIGTAYARMMVEGHKCNLVYYDPYPNKFLDKYISDYNQVLKNVDEEPISLRQLNSVEEVLKESDVSPQKYLLTIAILLSGLLTACLAMPEGWLSATSISFMQHRLRQFAQRVMCDMKAQGNEAQKGIN